MNYRTLNISVFDEKFREENKEFYNTLSTNLAPCKYTESKILPKKTEIVLINLCFNSGHNGLAWSDALLPIKEQVDENDLGNRVLMICPEKPVHHPILEALCEDSDVTPVYLNLKEEGTLKQKTDEYAVKVANKIRQILNP